MASTLELEGAPADALQKKFGARPKADFVQSAWPVLRTVWLSADAASRQVVVDKLMSAGLGRFERTPHSKTAQLNYLDTCRNSPKLREIVLAAFLRAGEPTQLSPPTISPPQQSQPDEQSSTQPASADDQSPKNLAEWVDVTLKRELGLSEVKHDDDGDIPFTCGSSVLFVRVPDKDAVFVEVFSPLLQDFELSAEVYEAVNSINAQVLMAKATVYPKHVILSAHLPVDSLTAKALIFTINLVGEAADHFDTLLQKRFGGKTMTADTADAIEV